MLSVDPAALSLHVIVLSFRFERGMETSDYREARAEPISQRIRKASGGDGIPGVYCDWLAWHGMGGCWGELSTAGRLCKTKPLICIETMCGVLTQPAG